MKPQVSNIIYVGPAGTGKTTQAKAHAVRVIDGQKAPTDLESISRRYRQLVEERRIFAPTLHPSYAYTDWVEGFRPATDDGGNLRWDIMPGVFMEAVNACGSSLPGFAAYFSPLETIQSSTGNSFTVERVETSRIILKRHKLKANSVADKDEVFFSDVQRCIDRGVLPSELSYSGADEENRAKRTAVAQKLGWSTVKLTSSGGLRAVYEHIIEAQTSGKDKGLPIVLVIDEINRADPGRLWGELITILEPNKRQGQPEAQPVYLQYSRTPLILPSNLHIIGTMNSADRSIAQFDMAYRRRFDFVWVGPEEDKLDTYAGVDLAALLKRVNRYIGRELGRDRQIGHAELMTHKIDARRIEHGWSGASDGELRALAYVLRFWLIPLLRDVFGNDLQKVRSALGQWGGIIEAVADPFEEQNGGDLWIDESEMLDDSGSWWDPLSAGWDVDRVGKVLCVAPPAHEVAA